MSRTTLVSVVAASVVLYVSADAAVAGAPMLVKAKEHGFPAQNCQYCHVSKLPKKETFKPDDLNERGKWLVAEKDRQKTKEVNAEWLTNYPGGKEQK